MDSSIISYSTYIEEFQHEIFIMGLILLVSSKIILKLFKNRKRGKRKPLKCFSKRKDLTVPIFRENSLYIFATLNEIICRFKYLRPIWQSGGISRNYNRRKKL